MEQNISNSNSNNEQTKSLSLTENSVSLTARYGNLSKFLVAFNPDAQYELSAKVEDCYFGYYPTLARLNKEYCSTASIQWLNIQIYNLNEFCGCKDKMSPQQVLDCSRTISTMYYYLKVSELMLFFFRFKAGKYGTFFGSVDPITITSALTAFLRERLEANAKHESKIAMMKVQEYRKDAISFKEWQKIKLNHKSQENDKEQ